MNTAAINPFKLPTISLSQRKHLPLVCAVYFVLHDNKVVYVGKATVLRQRWDSHHRIKEFKNLPGEVRIAWHKSDSPELIDELEKSMIARFKPSMNGSKVEYATPRKTIYLEPKTMEALKQRANKEKRTVSNLCNLLIEQEMSEWLKLEKTSDDKAQKYSQ